MHDQWECVFVSCYRLEKGFLVKESNKLAGHGSHLGSQDSRDGERKIKSLKPTGLYNKTLYQRGCGEKKINDNELPNCD